MNNSGLVIAFSGAIGTGKSALSKKVSELLHCPWVSFGEFVRKAAADRNENADDRAVLQRLGQALVLSDVDTFVQGVLDQHPGWKEADYVVVDGLRHVEVRYALINLLKRQDPPKRLRIVLVRVNEDARRRRAQVEKHLEARLLSRYDQDITEAQINRILPEYADVTIENDIPVDIAARALLSRLGVDELPMVAAE